MFMPILLEIKRTGLLGELAGLMHPGEARSATITAAGVRLTFPSRRTTAIAFDNLEKSSVKPGWFRDRIRFDHDSGSETISGVAQKDARAFAEAVETARENWLASENCSPERCDPISSRSPDADEGPARLRDHERRIGSRTNRRGGNQWIPRSLAGQAFAASNHPDAGGRYTLSWGRRNARERKRTGYSSKTN